MNKKAIYSILSTIVAMVVLSVSLVFAIGPKASADSEVIETVPVEYLSINDGVLGDGKIDGAFTADGKTWIQNHAKYCVEIPAGVTSIKNNAFWNCSGLTSITIPEGVTSIGKSAFENCRGLKSITIPESVTSIGDWAFRDCSGLTNVKIPSSVTSIGEAAFQGCSSLTSITIPSSVTSIAGFVFSLCDGLTSIEIPEGVISVGERAFWKCSGLTSIEIPASVTSIGDCAFWECSGLKSIGIPASVTSIDYWAFSDCGGLTSMTVDPNNTKYTSQDNEGHECNCIIEKSSNTLIYGCQNTIIPEGVASIGDKAFCSRELTSITIPESVTSIGEYIFYDCSRLNEIIVRNEDLLTNANLRPYVSKLHYGADKNKVTFVTNCDTSVNDRLINFGEVTDEPTGLTKEHYTFVGWYSDEQYTQPFTFDTPIKYNITVYAKWEEDPTVTFMVDCTEYSSETVEYNTLLTVPETPTREGYNFLGWFVGDEEYDFNTPVTEDMTLTAKWEAKQVQSGTPIEENPAVNNQNNNALILGIAGTAAGILIIGGIVFGIVISKRRRK